jgi:hypothetical protein
LYQFLRKADVVRDLDRLLRAIEDELDWLSLSQGSGGGGGSGGVEPGPAGLYACDPSVFDTALVVVDAADHVMLTDGLLPARGFVTSKPTPTTAIVQYGGEVDGFSDLVPGATYYMSPTPGHISSEPPSLPGNLVQRIGFAKNTTTIVIRMDGDAILLSELPT